MMNDNAGGGVRGLRARPSTALFEAVRAAYRIEIDTDPVDLGGSSSLNLRVTHRSSQYVLRVYRPYVSAERLEAIHQVRRALSLGGVPCGGLVATHDGRPWLSFGGRLVEMERYIEHDADMNTWDALEAGLPVLARMHDILRHSAVGAAAGDPLFANSIEPERALSATQAGTRRIRAWNPSPHEYTLADEADELARRLSDAAFPQQDDLPVHLVHGDFWDNNVFLRDGAVVFVSDFDFMGKRLRIDDLALTLYFTCLAFFEERVSDHQLGRLRRLLDVYDRASKSPLSAAERAGLPLAMACQPLWSIGGWVALLDDEAAARAHAVGTAAEVKWALRMMDEMARWQEAFA